MQLDKQHPWIDSLGMGVDWLIPIGSRFNYGTGIIFKFFPDFLLLSDIHKNAVMIDVIYRFGTYPYKLRIVAHI